MAHPRQWTLLFGTPAETAAPVRALLAAHPGLTPLWLSTRDEPGALRPRQLRDALGSSADLVVVDLHGGLAVDSLAAAQGFLRRGGRLVLRMDPAPVPDPRLALWPHGPDAVGTRLDARLRARLGPGATPLAPPLPAPPPGPTPDQDTAVHAIVERLGSDRPTATVLLAGRGRGKSAALGRALRQRAAGQRVVLCAPSPAAAREVHRFAGAPLPELRPVELVACAPCWDVIVVDEAARVPVPRLQQVCRAHPRAHLVFATTTHGYEGTGRGFVLRFLDWLAGQDRPLRRLSLQAPIRWDAADPLEAALDAALLLAARVPSPPVAAPGRPVHTLVDRDRLVADPALLAEVFGLLVHAHYRTTPADLHTLLDAPNVAVHLLRWGGRVVGVNLVAAEGGLPAARCAALARGEGRIRGHALADTLITHGGQPAAGRLPMLRSVRIATHPALRGQGLGHQLAADVHRHHQPALFGTLFGATPALLRFRRAQGYQLVRVGGSRGDRSGEPAAVMVRAETPQAHGIVDALRRELARSLPLQLALLDADGSVALSSTTRAALLAGLPAPTARSPAATAAMLRGYLDGPRTSDAVIAALRGLATPGALAALGPSDRALVEARVVRLASWTACAAAAGLPTVRAAQRQLKRACRRLAEATGLSIDEHR